MGLKINLKRGEKLFIPGGSFQCGDDNVVLFLEGNVPVLRERDVITADQANTPARRLLMALQTIYLAGKVGGEMRDLCILFMRDVLHAIPEGRPYLAKIEEQISAGDYFRAVKEARALVDFEETTTRERAA